jgi:hypothetical protein
MTVKAPFPGPGLLGLVVFQAALAQRRGGGLRHDVIRRNLMIWRVEKQEEKRRPP